MSAGFEPGLEVLEDDSRLPEPYHDMETKKNQGYPDYGPQILDNSAYQRHERHEKPRICGFSPAVFGVLVALITAVVVGGAVGGGLGGALSSAQSHTVTITTTIMQSTTQIPTASTTTNGMLLNYAVAAPTEVYSVPLDCPNIDGQVFTSTNGQTWALSCTVRQSGGDIGSLIAYTYQDCIQACAKLNYWQEEDVCTRIQFTRYMSDNDIGSPPYGNCWLKNDSSTTTSSWDGNLGASLIS